MTANQPGNSLTGPPGDASAGDRWWRNAVVYQIYPRSFADSNGDGVGDLRGITSRLDHLADLGVGALWLCPFYPSPGYDAGYDVADYRNVDPTFGTLTDLDQLIARAHELGIRVVLDIVVNHRTSTPGSARRSTPRRRVATGTSGGTRGPDASAGSAATSPPAGGPSLGALPGRGTAGRASTTSACSRRTSPTSTGRTPSGGPRSPT